MAKVIIKKWKAGKIAKSYEYLVDNEKQFIKILLERDKQRGYYRHIGEMSTCIEINPAGDAESCMNYRFGIQLCDDKDNYKSYRIDYPINPPKKTTKSKPGLSAPITIPKEGFRSYTLIEEEIAKNKEKVKRFQNKKDLMAAFEMRLADLEHAGFRLEDIENTKEGKNAYLSRVEGKYINNTHLIAF